MYVILFCDFDYIFKPKNCVLAVCVLTTTCSRKKIVDTVFGGPTY